ncbi:hypothetical protein ACFW5U_35755 [Streptomyces rochei]|uniref:hypothetical protein n=1 Tax=Streptomyces TaxID=1883 RepID=UPI000FB4A850|nr:hypothetical protein [Streptomyces sp. WAC08401]RSS11411.1 hypothetical protein EF915_25010 [Streptomyces sp. WAC08401]
MARTRVTVNRRVFSQIASSPEMASLLLSIAERGKGIAASLAPTYSGPTWGGVTRAGDYKRSLEAKLVRSDFGYRSEIAANVAYALQVEFGTGQRAATQSRDSRGRFTSSRRRPQLGHSPKWRPLGRALETMRNP